MQQIADQLERIANQADVALKLFLKEKKGERTTKDMIRELGSLGCKANDIANWLNAPLTNVAPELSRMKAEEDVAGPKKRARKKS
jgi:hypothetical protein